MKHSKFQSDMEQFAARRSKAVLVVYFVLRLLVTGLLVLNIIQKEYEAAFCCLMALIMFLLPSFLEHKLHVDLPNTLEIIVLLFIFAHEILGELGSYYITRPYWDTMLHTTCGFLMAAVGFSMIDILNRSSTTKFNLSPLYCAVAAFCFSMTIGVLWEFFEFSMDWLFATDMQKDTVITAIHSTYLDPTASNVVIHLRDITDVTVNGQALDIGGYLDIGLYDTMEDLFVNFIGAVVFSVIGYFYVKQEGKGRFAEQFIPTLTNAEDQPEENA